MTWLPNLIRTSVGRKQIMALTGLGMAGFLVIHLSGNFLLFAGADAFNGYADFLAHQKWLPLARIGLIAITLVHMGLAFQLTLQNRAARGSAYFYKDPSDASLASRTMIVSGLLVFIYLILHLSHFTFVDKDGPLGLYGLVVEKLSSPGFGSFYIAAMVVLGAHLIHAIQSTFQTCGISHPQHTPVLKKALITLAIAVCAGFASIPILLMITKGGA